MLKVEHYSDPAAFEQLRDEWKALEKQLCPRTPFASHMWHQTWWSHLRRQTWQTRDELLLCTVRAPSGELIAVAPFMATARPGIGPLRLIELQGLGADPHLTELRGVISQPQNLPSVMEALKVYFRETAPRSSWINWHSLPWPDGCPKALLFNDTSSLQYYLRRPQPAYLVDMPETWALFEKGLTKRVRKKIRSCHNSLQRDGHAFEFRVVSDPGLVNESIRTFYALIAMRSKVRHANPFEQYAIQEFFNDYAGRSADCGELRIFQLCIAEKVVATRIGFALGYELYLYHAGNDPAWDRYSIMTTLLVEVFRWAIQNGFRCVNLSTGYDRSKTRWLPKEIMFVDAVELMPGRVNAALYHMYTRIRSASDPAQFASVQPDKIYAWKTPSDTAEQDDH